MKSVRWHFHSHRMKATHMIRFPMLGLIMSSHHREFFGPVGTFTCTVALPLLVYGLALASNGRQCMSLYPFSYPDWVPGTQLFSWSGIVIVYGWFFGHMFLHILMPAWTRKGVVELDGNKWKYRLNGFQNFVLVYGAIFVFTFLIPVIPLSWAADHFLELISGATILAVSLAVALYGTSHIPGKVLAPSGTSGNTVYDFWMGRELNPRTWTLDWKEFCELHPGMMGWAVINLAFAHKQLQEFGFISFPMLMINGFQLLYVLDSLWYEASILTTMDITSEGFGFMLAFGDLVWVPFTYSIQAKFILEFNPGLTIIYIVLVLGIKLLGYECFRGANNQKDQFRRDPTHPSVKNLETMDTQRGTKLIVSGWWGWARHANYSGDWLMGVAWCLTTGLNCVVPFFYAAYFFVLLVHRSVRDDEACRKKYGKDWEEYCKRVPWRFCRDVY